MSETEVTKEKAPTKAKEEKATTIKVKALRPIVDPNTNVVAAPGTVIEVTESQAAELTREMKNVGAFAFRGERYVPDGDVKRHSLKRAEVVA
jgi:hypothetical protein